MAAHTQDFTSWDYDDDKDEWGFNGKTAEEYAQGIHDDSGDFSGCMDELKTGKIGDQGWEEVVQTSRHFPTSGERWNRAASLYYMFACIFAGLKSSTKDDIGQAEAGFIFSQWLITFVFGAKEKPKQSFKTQVGKEIVIELGKGKVHKYTHHDWEKVKFGEDPEKIQAFYLNGNDAPSDAIKVIMITPARVLGMMSMFTWRIYQLAQVPTPMAHMWGLCADALAKYSGTNKDVLEQITYGLVPKMGTWAAGIPGELVILYLMRDEDFRNRWNDREVKRFVAGWNKNKGAGTYTYSLYSLADINDFGDHTAGCEQMIDVHTKGADHPYVKTANVRVRVTVQTMGDTKKNAGALITRCRREICKGDDSQLRTLINSLAPVKEYIKALWIDKLGALTDMDVYMEPDVGATKPSPGASKKKGAPTAKGSKKKM